MCMISEALRTARAVPQYRFLRINRIVALARRVLAIFNSVVPWILLNPQIRWTERELLHLRVLVNILIDGQGFVGSLG